MLDNIIFLHFIDIIRDRDIKDILWKRFFSKDIIYLFEELGIWL